MQTPQAVKFHLAYRSFSKANLDGFRDADDVSFVERLGNKVTVIPGSPYNFKITHLVDMEVAKIVLGNRYV